MNDICCIGHITLDKIVTPKQTTYLPGGTSYYFSHGMRHLKDTKNYRLITALAPSEYKAVEEMREKGIQVKVLPSKNTVYFENTYGENQDNRTQRVLAKADPFTVEELKDEKAHIFHLGSLLSDDFSLDVVKMLSKKGILAVDAQGYLREVRGEKVYPVDWNDKKEALKYIDILKVNEHEAQVLTGYADPKQAATTGRLGSKRGLAYLRKPRIAHLRRGKIPPNPGLSSPRRCRCHRMWRHICIRILIYAKQRSVIRRSRLLCCSHVDHQIRKIRSFLRYRRGYLEYHT